MEKTGTWTWPESYSDLKLLEVKPSDIKEIKSLLVGWDVTELGAPAFITRNGDWLYDQFDDKPKKEQLLNLFLSQAKLDKTRNSFKNTFVEEDIDEFTKGEAIDSIPSKEIKQMLLTEKVIELEIDNFLEQLWDSCWLEARGFDPKRGFRLPNLQDLIDPKKLLSKSEITKKRKYYKGLLMLYLQLFIKEAHLELGYYHTYDGYHWIKGKDFKIAEEYTRYEWCSRINSCFTSEISDYIDLLSTLPKTLKLLSANGAIDYHKIVEIYNLKTLFKYDPDNINRLDISLEEIILKSFQYFPEEKQLSKNQEYFPFIFLLIRIYNIQGRFTEAQNLLQDNNMDLFTENQLEFFCTLPNKYQQIAFYESCICKMVSTGNYELWRFPEYPKFTESEIKEFDIYTGSFFLNIEEDKQKYEVEKKKIKRLLEKRGKLSYDVRPYFDYQYDNFDLIYEDLTKKNLRIDFDEIMVSIIGQIKLFNELKCYKN